MRYLYITLISCLLALNLPVANAQIITTVAGNGTGGYSGDGGQATNAEIYVPTGVAIDDIGNLYIVDYNNYVIRKVNTSGIITTIAGNGINGFSGDGGQATSAELSYPQGVFIDELYNVYIADANNNCIRKVNTAGIINTIVGNGFNAGSGFGGYNGDGGQATNAELDAPYSITFDAFNNMFISDAGNHVIRKVNTSGIISTVAGNGFNAGTGPGGYSGDGGQATNAELNFPSGIAIDAVGNMYIADNFNYRIRKVNTSGIITTIAGIGTGGYSGDGGLATAAKLNSPAHLCLDASNNLYFADISNNRIRRINTAGIITTIAGNGVQGFAGDGGQATNAEFFSPADVTLDLIGNLYITDTYNQQIRKVTNVAAAGIEQFANSNEQVTVYPNPATNSLQVSFSGSSTNTEITITDMLGNTVKQMPFNTQHVTLNIGDLGEGVYNISITSKEGVVNKRVVIVR